MTEGLRSPPPSEFANDCLICSTPLSGLYGAIARIAGVRRTPQNPNLCNRCSGHIEEGSIVELGVLFADLTDYTRLTHELGPERTHQILEGFRRMATNVILRWDGFVTQFVGDEVMAFFNAPLRRSDFKARAVNASAEMQERMNELSSVVGEPVKLTIGIAAGHARVGRVGSEEMKDYMAIGDVVNRAARLVAHIEPGGILVAAAIYAAVATQFPAAPHERISIKGFTDPIDVTSLHGQGMVALREPALERGKRPLRAAMLLSAILGAPCAGVLISSPFIVTAGASAAASGGVGALLDESLVRLPLLAIATSAALATLAALGRQLWMARSSTGSNRGQPTTFERRGVRLGIFLALIALTVVAIELFAHALMH